jgi:hypothetical protein
VSTVSATLTFPNMDMASLANPAARSTFETGFKQSLADSAGVTTDLVVIDSITAGSVRVASTVNLPPTATVTPAAFSTMLSSDPASLFTPAFLMDVGGAVEADDLSTGTAYITMASPPPPSSKKRGKSVLESESGGTGVVATSARALLMAAGATLTALLMAM